MGAGADPLAGRDQLVFAGSTMPESLDVLAVVDTTAQEVFRLVYDGLVELDSNTKVVPNLAERWEVSEDGLEWVFHIRRGVKFHDGSTLSSHDVKYTYDYLLDPANRHATGRQLDFISSTEARDDFTFVLHLAYPFTGVLYALNSFIAPMPEAGGGLYFQPVGTGAYRFVYRDERQIVLEAFDEYHRMKPAIPSVVFRYMPSKEAAWAALLQGDVDVIVDLSLSDYELIEDNPKFTVYEYPSSFYYTLLFNTDDPILQDPALRRAIVTAADRADLIHVALDDKAIPARGPFGPNSDIHMAGLDRDRADVKDAMERIANLGWVDTDRDGIREKDGRDLRFELIIDEGDPIKERVARRLRWQLFQIGVGVDVKKYAVSEYLSERLIPGAYQLSVLQFNATSDPASSLMLFWHTEAIGRSNPARYSNPRVDRLIEEARHSLDPDFRDQTFHRINELITEDAPAAFLFFRNHYIAASSRIVITNVRVGSIFGGVRKWYFRE